MDDHTIDEERNPQPVILPACPNSDDGRHNLYWHDARGVFVCTNCWITDDQ